MVQQHAACNAAHNLEERLCRRTLLTHDRAGGDLFPLAQDYLSLMLGVRRRPLTQVAHRLKEDGVISYARCKFRVLDRRRLEERSCACYRLIKEQVARTFHV
jgi:CRP-like cAMP-binding protein